MNLGVVLVILAGALLGPHHLQVQAAKAIPKKVVVEEGEGFILHLLREAENELEFDSCQLSVDDDNRIVLAKGEMEKKLDGMTIKMVKSTKDECAIRVSNVKMSAPTKWRLQGNIEKMNRQVGDNVDVEVKKRSTNCPTTTSSDKLCLLINKDSKEEKNCSSRGFSKSAFDCFFFARGSMEFKQENAPKPDYSASEAVDSKYTPVKYEARLTILECETPSKKIRECTLSHSPSDRNFKISPGLANPRYSSLLTDFEKGVCQFEIPYSIKTDETGLWVMKIKTMDNVDTECQFQVHFNYHELSEMTKETTLIKTTEHNVNIPCAKDLHYPLTRCYLQTSDKKKLKFKSAHELTDNNCEFTVPSGTEWTCGFNAPDSKNMDLIRKFNVQRFDKEVINTKITTHADGSITMECHEINDRPIKNCMFLSPSEMMSVPEPDSTGRYNVPLRYSYYGNGFAKGHCGIRFPRDPAKPVEKGTWKCYIQQEGKDETIHEEMEHK